YKRIAIGGAALIAAGTIVFATMDGSTTHWVVVLGMALSGIGMGLVQPVYTVAVQNAAPRQHMGTATASSQFFRSIGSTVGVATFGSVLLTMYKHEFASGAPPGAPQEILKYFYNPLMLPLIRPQLESIVARYPGGPELLEKLLQNVRTSLAHGIHL